MTVSLQNVEGSDLIRFRLLNVFVAILSHGSVPQSKAIIHLEFEIIANMTRNVI